MGFAIKIPSLRSYVHFLSGLQANVIEAKNWRYAKAGVFPCDKLCPILYRGLFGTVLVMTRVRVMTENEFAQFDSVEFCELGNAVLPVEHKSDSYG
jgi:hypothetical protein